MQPRFTIKDYELTCAKDLLDALDETDKRWRGEKWIYRGQNVDRVLLPTAMRPCKIIHDYVNKNFDSFLKETKSDSELEKTLQHFHLLRHKALQERGLHFQLLEELKRKYKDVSTFVRIESGNMDSFEIFRECYVTSSLHRFAEMALVGAFIEIADQAGLTIPHDSFSTFWNSPFPLHDHLRNALDYDASDDEKDISVFEFAFALARHHGVPARLLDCTYRPLVAAYFAADCDESVFGESDSRIVVWAVHQESLPDDIQIVKHRRSEIGYLRAQDGLFLCDARATDKYWLLGEWAPLDFYFHDLVENRNAFKFTLPFSERKTLLDLLALKGVSKPVLMPSFDNAASILENESFNLASFLRGKM